MAAVVLLMLTLLSACYRDDDIGIPGYNGEYLGGTAGSLSESIVTSIAETTAAQTTTEQRTVTMTSKTTSTTTSSISRRATTSSTTSQTPGTTKAPTKDGGIPLITERTTAAVTTLAFPRVTRRTRPSSDEEYKERIEKEWLPYYEQTIQELQQAISAMKQEIEKLEGYLEESQALLRDSQERMKQAEKDGDGGAFIAYRESAAIRQQHVDYYNKAIQEVKTAIERCEDNLQQAELASADYKKALEELEAKSTGMTEPT